MDYRKRLQIPVDEGNPNTVFTTESGIKVANGYERIVIGERGPYIEFAPFHIVGENIHIPVINYGGSMTNMPPKYSTLSIGQIVNQTSNCITNRGRSIMLTINQTFGTSAHSTFSLMVSLSSKN